MNSTCEINVCNPVLFQIMPVMGEDDEEDESLEEEEFVEYVHDGRTQRSC